MTCIHEEFKQIQNTLALKTCYTNRVDYLRDLGAEHLHRFDSLVGRRRHRGDCLGVFYSSTSTLMFVAHSTHAPAIGTRYFLFNLEIKQPDWFQVLGFTLEEQLMHTLKWGRYP